MPRGVRYEGPGQYLARVMIDGDRLSETFPTAQQAADWIAQKKYNAKYKADPDAAVITKGKRDYGMLTLGEMLDTKHREFIEKENKNPRSMLHDINRVLRYPIANIRFDRVTAEDVNTFLNSMTYRDIDKKSGDELKYVGKRVIKPVSETTKQKYVAMLSKCYENAVKFDWVTSEVSNPTKKLAHKPKSGDPRDRRLIAGEFEYLIDALNDESRFSYEETRNTEIEPLFRIALGTGVRQNELVNLRWEWFRDLNKLRSFQLPGKVTKNSKPRVPIIFPHCGAVEAIKTLWVMSGKPKSGKVFKSSANALGQAYERALAAARKMYVADCQVRKVTPDDMFLVNLTWHDLRHEAISWLFENTTLDGLVIMRMVGHKTMATTMRYMQLRDDPIIDQIDRDIAAAEARKAAAAAKD